LQPAQLYLPMHWGSMYLSGMGSKGQRLAGVNALTTPERCPRSKQPELKHVAVKLLKAELPWTCLGMAWLDEQQVQSVRQALTELMAEFDFASCVLFGRAVPLEQADQGRTGAQSARGGLCAAQRRGAGAAAWSAAARWPAGHALCRRASPMQPGHGDRPADRGAQARCLFALR
jgi:hypothetical protein